MGEIKILQTLKFNLFEPLSLHFLRRFSKAGDVDVLQHSLAKFAIELALVEYDLVPVPGSKLAASALCLSLILLEPKEKQDGGDQKQVQRCEVHEGGRPARVEWRSSEQNGLEETIEKTWLTCS